ncbi:MAG: hypothetical protein APF76_09545 [Desulfitibacter sp. BRH_c19]|nr:MAG: hypothetical protein APF76_09545 [Desulfitibacter sp. BRH_c19]
MRFGINLKIRILLVFLVVIILLFVCIFLNSSIQKYYSNQQAESLLENGVTLATKLGVSENLNDYGNEIVFLSDYISTDIIVIDRDRKIIATTENIHLNVGMYMESEEVNEVFQGNAYIDQGEHFGFENPRISVAVPIYQGDTIRGALLLSKSEESFTTILKDFRQIILIVGFVAIVLTLIIAPIVSNRFIKPLSQIREVAQNMLLGDFSGRVSARTNDELGDLAKCFNSLSEELEKSVGALSQEKDKLVSVIESINEGVLTFDKDRNLTLVNPQTKIVLGNDIDREGITNSKEGKLIAALVYKSIKRRMLVEREIEINSRIVSLKANPLKDSKIGEIIGAVIVIQDVTVQKRINQIRKEFLASVSHEIRTPLSIMQGYTEALIDGMATNPEDQNTYLLIIKDEILRLKVLVNDLLDINKMETGNFALKKDYYDIRRLIERVNTKYSSFIAETAISLELTLQPDLPLVYGDERRIEQALINLLENAIKHTPSDGRIIISSYCEDQKIIVQVTDNGEGIPQDEIHFIWDRFFKVDKARTREKAGSGLGLAIVKNIIEAHGGVVGVRSVEGEGSMFKIEFPIV